MSSSFRLSSIDAQLLTSLERAFERHAGVSDHIDVARLQQALGLRSEYLAARVLRNFDCSGDGLIDREEFLRGVRGLLLGSDRDKLMFAFRLHDEDGDGFIGQLELLRMIAISLAEDEVQTRASQPPEPTTVMPTASSTREVHPEGRFPIKSGAHEGIGCRPCHDQGGAMGKDDTDCVQCHARTKYDRIHERVRDYPQDAAPLNFCLRCHASGRRR